MIPPLKDQVDCSCESARGRVPVGQFTREAALTPAGPGLIFSREQRKRPLDVARGGCRRGATVAQTVLAGLANAVTSGSSARETRSWTTIEGGRCDAVV